MDIETGVSGNGNQPSLELWKNAGESSVVLKKTSVSGSEIEEIVRGGKSVHISPHDRQINEERIEDAEFNFFRNGTLTPVRLVDEETAAEFASNENLMSESDMRKLVKGAPKAFVEKLETLTNVIIVSRLLSLAEEEDASFKRVEAIRSRLVELQPSRLIHSADVDSDKRR